MALTGCSDGGKTYKVGVAQCSKGPWRDKVNQEMQAAQHLYEHDVKVNIVNSVDDPNLQARQIDSLAQTDIDLMVVAPYEDSQTINEAIARVLKAGIPVVSFDRKTSADYTAFIGGNNVEAGFIVGQYIASMVRGGRSEKCEVKGERWKVEGGRWERPLVVEITGLLSSTPALERHRGFEKAMNDLPEVEYVCRISDWSSDASCRIATELIDSLRRFDVGRLDQTYVFCHNDGMATGVYKAVVEQKVEGRIKILGIDGMPGEGQEYVKLGHQVGTYYYPTHGEKIIRLALDILTGKPFERENPLLGFVITPDNVELVSMESAELMRQNDYMVTIHDKLENYFGLYNVQSKVITACVTAILLMTVAILLSWRARKKIKEANRRIQLAHDEQTAFYTNARHQLRTPLTLIAGPVREISDSRALKGHLQELIEIVGRNVNQLETVISSVLNFKMGVTTNTVEDDTAASALQTISADALQESRLAMMKQEDTDELATVLMVDDNRDMRLYLRTLLADKFYVLEAAEGQEGLRIARECVPDIVISDVMMPVMDGLQFCKRLKEDAITSHIPVILLTARSTEAQQTEGYEHGADAYLTKPFTAGLLIARIYNLLKNREQLRHLADGKQEEAQVTALSTQDKLFADSLKETFLKHMSNPDLKMDDLGDELGMSRVQLYRKVKALTGISPVELLREMRLQRGYNLINTTTKSISEIAYEVGFHTPSYFSNCFKKQFGQYPTELRAE